MANTSFNFSETAENMHAGAAEWEERREILAAEALREDERAEGWRLLGVTLFEE